MIALHHPIARYMIMAVIAGGFAVQHNHKVTAEHKAAQMQFAQSANADAMREALKVKNVFRSIYENIRTISRMPSVIKIDRHGKNLSVDGRETLQQIYNNLTSRISVSEVYIVSANFDPETVDPTTGKPERPIVVIDQLINRTGKTSTAATLSGKTGFHGKPRGGESRDAEAFAYRQLKEHQIWLKKNYPTDSAIEELNVPMIGGSVATAPNSSDLANTKVDGDRSSLMLSVPFYGRDGSLRGSVTARIESSAIRTLLPVQNYALINTHYNYASRTHKNEQERSSSSFITRGVPDPTLIASSVIDITTYDPRSTWRLWAGIPNKTFHDSAAVSSIRRYEIGGYVAILLLVALLVFMQWEGAARVEAQRAVSVASETKKAEQETRRLNLELEANMEMLSKTQQKLVKHERLSALGQVTATLSHEIRNPLAAIRSSLFTIRRTAEKANIKLDRSLDRADRSVVRCDNLIGDFLEFTRTNKLDLQSIDASMFLHEVLDEQIPPVGISLTRDLQRRARRLLLIQNASDG